MGMSLDEFLGHKSSTYGGGGKVLNWKKRKPPQLTTWLHTQAPFVALWRHGWPRIVDIERDGEKTREVWGGSFNCWENEETLKKQYRRTQDGARVIAPERCPLCLVAEYLRGEVDAGRLAWTEPVFEFVADDDRNSVVLTAAGIYNGFGGDLSRQDIADLRRAGIRRDEAWKQNCMAKCSYVFSLVDEEDSAAGVQVCVETTALGDAVKRVIRDQMDALGETEGHPLKTPYAIRWEYHPDEQEFSKKYRALALPKVSLSPEVRALIVEATPPDIKALIDRGDAIALRAVMETAAKIDLPFDDLFAGSAGPVARATAPVRAALAANRRAARPTEGDYDDAPPTASPETARQEAARVTDRHAGDAPRRRRATRPSGPQMPDYPPGTVLVTCDSRDCGVPMADTDDTCWKCGAKYDLEPDPEPARPPAKARDHAKPVGGPVQPTPAQEPEDEIPW